MDTNKRITDVLAAHERGKLRHYSVSYLPDGGASIAADGPEDHARAMEILAAINRVAPAPSDPQSRQFGRRSHPPHGSSPYLC